MPSSVKLILQDSKQKAISAAQAALEKKASDVVILEVAELTSVADYFVIASGESERQVKAISQNIEKLLSSQFNRSPQIEGAGTSTWILLDYGDIIVHVFKTDIREYYGLEKMWSDAPQIPIPEQESSASLQPQYAKGTQTRGARYGS
jgi:ribosome-associated protein